MHGFSANVRVDLTPSTGENANKALELEYGYLGICATSFQRCPIVSTVAKRSSSSAAVHGTPSRTAGRLSKHGESPLDVESTLLRFSSRVTDVASSGAKSGLGKLLEERLPPKVIEIDG